jgi:nucleotide-binding universal stress UspA family protein
MAWLATILAPIDFSERSLGAVRYARLLACHCHAELSLVHVLSPSPQHVEETPLSEMYDHRASGVEQQMRDVLAGELAGLSVKEVILEGEVAREIVEYAHNQHADLIVMATHGYTGFRPLLLGSSTAKVLHDAACAVWTGVHMEEMAPFASAPFRNVLCALDLGPQSRTTLEWAIALQREFDARLGIIHVTMPIPDQGDAIPLNWDATVRNAAADALSRLMEETGVAADVVIEPGDPALAICSAVRRANADVLVIGRGSAAGIFGRLRTNAYALIRQSPCPVVSV